MTDLFNIKKGYSFASNSYLAEETGLAVNKLRATLLILESGEAIVRCNVTNVATGQPQRVIYPATAIIPRPALGQGEGAPSWGRGGEPQQLGHQNLRRIPRIQSSQIALAKAESARRDDRRRPDGRGPASAANSALAPADVPQGCPSSGATRDSEDLSSTEQDARAVGIERAAAGDRPCDARGGIALDRADESVEDEEGEWTL